MKYNLGYRFLKSWRAGEPGWHTTRGVFTVEDPEGGPRFWAYRGGDGLSKAAIRAAIAEAFGRDRRDGMPPKISGAYPHYVVTWEG